MLMLLFINRDELDIFTLRGNSRGSFTARFQSNRNLERFRDSLVLKVKGL